MASLTTLLEFPPLTPEDMNSHQLPLIIPQDVLQLQADVCNVEEGRVDISTFTPEYQQRIKDYYRTAGVFYNSKSHYNAQKIRETMDII